MRVFTVFSRLLIAQRLDLAYLQTRIDRVFIGRLNFENLHSLDTGHSCFMELLNKCCIFKCFKFSTVFVGFSFLQQILQSTQIFLIVKSCLTVTK